jgi:glycosyltransferase involved in cell wall biosynthesis
MNAAPEISVVMGVFNHADTLPAALASVLAQEGVQLEFIVVDDGSTDGSAAILDQAAARDPRLKVVHKANEGLTRALMEGCARATAPWIARQDADDVSLPGRLQAQLARARQPDAPVLVGCGCRILAPEGEVLEEYHPPADPAAAARRVLQEGQAISPHGSILFRRDAYEKAGGYRAAFYYAQDIDLTTRLAENGPVAAVPDILYDYPLSPAAITGRFGKSQRAFYRLIRQGHRLRRQGRSESRLLAQAERLSRACRRRRSGGASRFVMDYFVGCWLLRQRPDRALHYLEQAVQASPWSVRARVRRFQARRLARAATAKEKGS